MNTIQKYCLRIAKQRNLILAPLLLGLLAFVFAGCVYYPETIPDKKAWLKQSADILRLAIDTNQIELACSKLTNQPETVLAIKNYSQQAIADLDKAAGLLLNPKLTSGGTAMGELAEIVDPDNPKEIYYFDFSPYGRLCDFDKRTIAYTNGYQRTSFRMDFYNNGKLSMVTHSAGGSLSFGENGELENSIINGKYLIIK